MKIHELIDGLVDTLTDYRVECGCNDNEVRGYVSGYIKSMFVSTVYSLPKEQQDEAIDYIMYHKEKIEEKTAELRENNTKKSVDKFESVL